MKIFRNFLESQEKHFVAGGKLERLYPLYEATYTFMYTPGTVTQTASHVRDALDLKRMMIIVVVSLIPAVAMGMYNTGLQANLALQKLSLAAVEGWRGSVLAALGIGIDAGSVLDNVVHGALYFIPLYLITIAAGGVWEVVFATVRRHEITEGFLVTSLLFPLTLPPDIPWWQVVIGISFGVVIGKEIFGGVGMNILNPALTARAFLYFAYPAQISGDAVWVAVDGFSRATPLAELADPVLKLSVTMREAFIGIIPGSIGETSTLACLIGAFVLIVTRIGSWRIMLSVVLGMVGLSALLNFVGSATNPMFQVTPAWHFVLGGFAFGAVFMATDPVSAAMTLQGQWFYGILIGALTVLVRVINPAFPEGMMLAILFGNLFAPIIDKIFINRNIKRRLLNYGR
ncbi:NADH:ubiquinone reductase (Na(+)-transporting) subunit B [candidate division KSB1 bacterium]|nr:NADH:ubiquinone reductase (Na(+)-transporting) subunit B [candidate division KSB1 bacterium]